MVTDLEHRLRAAMHAAVDDEQPPSDLTADVIRRHRRRSVVLAWVGVAVCVTVVTAVLPAVLASHFNGVTPETSRTPTPGRTATPAPIHQPRITLRGAPMPRGTNLRLMLAGSRLAWYSTAAHRAQLVAGLPPVRGGYDPPIRVVGGWAVQPYTNAPSCAPACGAPSSPVYFIPDGARRAIRIGSGYTVAASGSRSAVWLISYGRATRHHGTAPGSARLVSIRGQPIDGSVSLPVGYGILRGVGGYLLLEPLSQGPAGPPDKLLDPSPRRVVRTFGEVIAADAEQVAWGWSCDGCPVNVFDVRTGRTTVIAIPRGSWAVNSGTFSSDGALLAVQLSTGIDRYGQAHIERIGVIDLASGRLSIAPGVAARLDANGYLTFGWQPGSHRLLVATGGSGPVIQIGYWQPGAACLRVASARIPRGMSPTLDQ